MQPSQSNLNSTLEEELLHRTQLYEASIRHFFRPVLPFMDDPDITEIMINGHEQVYVEKQGQVQHTRSRFDSEASLMAAVRNVAEFVNRPIGDGATSLDARLPNGSRVHAILPPACPAGVTVTIRKFREAAFTLDELEGMGSLTEESRDILRGAIQSRRNIVVAGATGAGKTSILNALSREIASRERIVVIEDNSELKLEQPHQVCLESTAELSLRDLFVNALRMRPDRIVIGEVRRGEALELVQAMLTGHDGSLSTLHASSPQVAATRLETLCLQSDVQLPIYVARQQIASAVDVIVQAKRLPDGRRVISEVAELVCLDPQQRYQWQTLYKRSEERVCSPKQFAENSG